MPVPGQGPHLLAIASGKGGVGKSFLTASLSWVLAQAGWRVIAVDADFGGPNLHTCLGIPASSRGSLSDLAEAAKPLNALLCETAQPGLRVICGNASPLHAPNLKPAAWHKAVESLRLAPADFVLIDLGAGASYVTVDMLLQADTAVIVSTPEPTGMENAYRLLKTLFYRFVASQCRSERVRRIVTESLYLSGGDQRARSPHALLRELAVKDAGLVRDIERALEALRIWIVGNQIRSDEEVDLADAMATAARKVFAIPCRPLGVIPYDPAVGKALRERKPYFLAAGKSEAAFAVRQLAERFGVPSRTPAPATAEGGARG